jgi:AFG3 family protein
MGLMKGGKGKAGKGGFTGTMDETKSYRLKDAIKVTFKDVVGMQKSKEEIV